MAEKKLMDLVCIGKQKNHIRKEKLTDNKHELLVIKKIPGCGNVDIGLGIFMKRKKEEDFDWINMKGYESDDKRKIELKKCLQINKNTKTNL